MEEEHPGDDWAQHRATDEVKRIDVPGILVQLVPCNPSIELTEQHMKEHIQQLSFPPQRICQVK